MCCTARRSLEEKVLNTEVDAEVPQEVQRDAEDAAGGGPAGSAGVASDELQGADVDEGVVNDSETFRCQPCDPEGAECKVSPDPGEPTVSQIEDHRACGHWPFRSWCPECIRGRGGCEQHRRRTEARAICVFSFDYLHLDEAGNVIRREDMTAETVVALTILVANDSRTTSPRS